MRYLIASLLLVVCSSFVMADTFVSTSGTSYTKAADGHYYPSAYVLPTGKVLPPNYFTHQLNPFANTQQQFFVAPTQNFYSCPNCQGFSCPNCQGFSCPNCPKR